MCGHGSTVAPVDRRLPGRRKGRPTLVYLYGPPAVGKLGHAFRDQPGLLALGRRERAGLHVTDEPGEFGLGLALSAPNAVRATGSQWLTAGSVGITRGQGRATARARPTARRPYRTWPSGLPPAYWPL